VLTRNRPSASSACQHGAGMCPPCLLAELPLPCCHGIGLLRTLLVNTVPACALHASWRNFPCRVDTELATCALCLSTRRWHVPSLASRRCFRCRVDTELAICALCLSTWRWHVPLRASWRNFPCRVDAEPAICTLCLSTRCWHLFMASLSRIIQNIIRFCEFGGGKNMQNR